MSVQMNGQAEKTIVMSDQDFDKDIIKDGTTPEQAQQYYNNWAHKYDEDIVRCAYNGPKYILETLRSLNLPKTIKVVDLLGGTGLVAKLLREEGFENIDCLDGSPKMMAIGKTLGRYNDTHCSFIGRGHRSSLPDDTYDLMTATGAWTPGQIYPDAFDEVSRIIKPGGVMLWARRKGYDKISPEYGTFDDEVEKRVSEGKWRHLQPRKEIPDYILGEEGLLYVLQKA